MNTRDQLRKRCQRRYRELTIDGIDFRLQSMTEAERSSVELSPLPRLRAVLIATCLVDEDGDRLYTDSDEDIDELLKLDSRITVPLSDAISDHCQVAELEELVKNFEETPDAALQSV